MQKSLLARFGIRWLVSFLGLWVATGLLGSSNFSIGSNHVSQILVAGLVVALINMALKPLLIVLSLPAIILSLGLFMLVVNAFVILLASWIDSSIYINSFWIAIVTGVILGLVNLLVSRLMRELER